MWACMHIKKPVKELKSMEWAMAVRKWLKCATIGACMWARSTVGLVWDKCRWDWASWKLLCDFWWRWSKISAQLPLYLILFLMVSKVKVIRGICENAMAPSKQTRKLQRISCVGFGLNLWCIVIKTEFVQSRRMKFEVFLRHRRLKRRPQTSDKPTSIVGLARYMFLRRKLGSLSK